MTYMTLKAIGFDLFGTLLQAEGDSAICLKNMHKKLCQQGIDINVERFSEIYRKIHEEDRSIRTSKNKEITNQLELYKVLRKLNYKIDANSQQILDAVRAYFSTWTVTTFEGTEEMLRNLNKMFIIGVITNFTDPTFIYKTLREHNLLTLFNYVIISSEVGWRKPSPKIFNEFLRQTKVEAQETLFIGDDISCDIAGARAVGMKTILLSREKYDKEANYIVQPNYIISSIREINNTINYLK